MWSSLVLIQIIRYYDAIPNKCTWLDTCTILVKLRGFHICLTSSVCSAHVWKWGEWWHVGWALVLYDRLKLILCKSCHIHFHNHYEGFHLLRTYTSSLAESDPESCKRRITCLMLFFITFFFQMTHVFNIDLFNMMHST